MRIVMLLPSYPPDSFGGAEQHTKILAQAFIRMGMSAIILAPTQTKSAAGVREEDGIRIVRFFTRKPPFLGGRHLLSLITWWRHVYSWLRSHKNEIDIISIQHLRLHSAPGVRAAVKFNKVVSGKLGRGGEHFDLALLNGKRLPLGRWLANYIKRSPMLYIANSVEIMDDLRNNGIASGAILEIPNGVVVPIEPTGCYADPCGIRRFVFAGRLEREKGIVQLLGAFVRLLEVDRAVQLDIYGNGPLRGLLAESIDRFGLHEKIRILGIESDRSVIFRDAAYFVLPSDSEGMSNALLEAMAFGVVPIVTPVSGSMDLINSPLAGILMPDNNENTILAALSNAISLSQIDWMELSESARVKIAINYDIDFVARRYADAYSARILSK